MCLGQVPNQIASYDSSQKPIPLPPHRHHFSVTPTSSRNHVSSFGSASISHVIHPTLFLCAPLFTFFHFFTNFPNICLGQPLNLIILPQLYSSSPSQASLFSHTSFFDKLHAYCACFIILQPIILFTFLLPLLLHFMSTTTCPFLILLMNSWLVFIAKFIYFPFDYPCPFCSLLLILISYLIGI